MSESDPFAPLWRNGRRLVALGGLLLVGATLLPWISLASAASERTLRGYESDGLTTGIFGGLLLLVALLKQGQPGERYSLAAALLGTFAGLVIALSLWRVRELSGLLSGGVGSASIGAGMYLSFFGALLATYGGYQRPPAR